MLGPLPPLHRALVALCALAVFVAAGAWVTLTLTGPLPASTGAGVGAGIGAAVGLLLLHDFSPSHPVRPRAVAHVRRHR